MVDGDPVLLGVNVFGLPAAGGNFLRIWGCFYTKKHIPVCILNIFSALKHLPNRQKIPPAALSFAQKFPKFKSYGFKSCFQIPAIPTRMSN